MSGCCRWVEVVLFLQLCSGCEACSDEGRSSLAAGCPFEDSECLFSRLCLFHVHELVATMGIVVLPGGYSVLESQEASLSR